MDLAAVMRHMMDAGTSDPAWTELCEAVAELAQGDLSGETRTSLPAKLCDELEDRRRRAAHSPFPVSRTFIHEVHTLLVESTRQRLTCLSAPSPNAAGNPQLEKVLACLQLLEADLQRTAFALDLLELIEPAVLRAAQLRDSVADESCSDQADRLLDEATRCYLYGLYTACAALSSSILKEAIHAHSPAFMRRSHRWTAMLEFTRGQHPGDALPHAGPSLEDLIKRVEKAHLRATHQGLLTEDEARDCLLNARRAVQILLASAPPHC